MARTRSGMKGRRDSGRHYQVPHSVADTVAYCSLSAHAQKLWHDLLLQYNGVNNGHIAAILTQLAKRGWTNGTLYRSGPVCLNSDLSILSGISADSHAASLTVGSITA